MMYKRTINKGIILTLACIMSSAAWAEDAMVDIYSNLGNYNQTDIYAVAEDASSNAVTTEPSALSDSSEVPLNDVSLTAQVVTLPGLTRQDLAALHLSILQDEIDAMTQVGFFGSLFSANEELQQALMQDIELFLAIYSDLPMTAEAMILKGKMLSKQNHPEAAAVAWLQTMYEFPKTDAALQAKKDLKTLVEDDWDDSADAVHRMIKNVPNDTVASRIRSLINQLYPLDDKEVVEALTLLQLDFLERFSTDPHADEVQILLAHNLGAGSAESGIFGFKKLLALYPNSSYRAEAMLAIADLQRLRLKAYEKAASNYKILIAQHPEHKLTKRAYENLALTQASHLRLYSKAIATNEKIVSLYPQDKAALKALQNMAELQAKKVSEPENAVVTLRKLATMFHGHEATDALKDAIKLADKKIKNDKLAFDVRQQLLNDYPDSDEAPDALFDMAEYTEKTGDKVQAKALYERLIEQYPNEKSLIKKARKRVI
ncbi:MAG: tetratricopeptide repeat protein [Ghiorsea sp.]